MHTQTPLHNELTEIELIQAKVEGLKTSNERVTLMLYLLKLYCKDEVLTIKLKLRRPVNPKG